MTGILVVDDNPTNAKLLRVVLAQEGYDVRTAGDADSALAVLETFEPRMILMDVQLPGVDGLELTRRLKADPRYARIIVVAVTANAMKGDEERVRQAGCDDYMTKPIDLDTFLGSVEAHLSR